MPRFHCPVPLTPGEEIALPPGPARHVQVLRLQPGDAITLFHGGADGPGGEFEATVTRMGRSEVLARIGTHHAVEREAPRAVHLLAGITANERMDWLVEKATELGVASITPLLAERSVLKLKGERADKKLAHWQAVAVAACEQCGRNRVPELRPVAAFRDWAAQPSAATRWMLAPEAGESLAGRAAPAGPVELLVGPEGGLSEREVDIAQTVGFLPVSLGPRVLRTETAPLAALAAMQALWGDFRR